MAPKNKTPAPIDRPLSRAYLRQFVGWSTAYPPGVSEPNSLRLMENMMVNRDGSCRVRPGLRYFNYETQPTDDDVGIAAPEQLVGTHESFFTENGRAYLYAVVEDDSTVGFRVYADDGTGNFVIQTLAEANFEVPQSEDDLNFTEATTYVKYLQIDNKIFALSNAGESMRLFNVGEDKKAQRLYSISRPEWDTDDKLTVVHPEAAWINDGVPVATRINRILNPSFENSMDRWNTANDYTRMIRSDDFAHSGGYSMKLASKPVRTNLIPKPLHDVSGGGGIGGWNSGDGVLLLAASGTYLRVRIAENWAQGSVLTDRIDIEGDTRYRVGFTLSNDSPEVNELFVRAKYYNASGDLMGASGYVDHTINDTSGRKETDNFVTPSGARTVKIEIGGDRASASGLSYFEIKDVYFGLNSEGDTSALDGDDGANYFWTDGDNDSASVYHPPQDLHVRTDYVNASPGDYYGSFYARAGSDVRNMTLRLTPANASGTALSSADGTPTADGSGVWTRIEGDITAPSNTAEIRLVILMDDVPRGEVHYVDSVLLEKASALDDYFSGATADVAGFTYEWNGDNHDSRSFEYEYAGGDTNPSSETKTVDTLISSTAADNEASVGMFYTFSNEIGESAASQATVVRVQRPWSSWRWETPDGDGEPSGTETKVPELCADQLVAYMSEDVFDEAIAAGAIAWSLYMFTWTDQDPFPVQAVLLQKRELSVDSVYGTDSWARMTPSQAEISTDTAIIPTKQTRLNSSYPSHAGQGLVAADRMVMVLDPNEQAVIRWSSNQQGSYTDFSTAKGGGFKTLTYGNLMVPACVKLWQNPQSADTLTILCLGVDGHSTGYYMAPAQIASQSEAVNVMGFEETTATPGTTSPFGCEVLNNSLYHPLDEQLMKSVASNYNINHTSMTDKILDGWQRLQSKEHIVSSQLDNRLYYLVNNPNGDELEDGCWGNEIWVFDAQQKMGTWSRWTVQGQSLRKIERNGKIVMSLVRPDGIYYFDPDEHTDNYVLDGDVYDQAIDWLMETNTQGANRAHDAWSNLQQVNLTVGNFQGQMRYGIRGLDVHGKPVDISKIVRDSNDPGTEAYDLEDFLLIRKVMKEWFFYAEAVTTDGPNECAGQISLVQYRYTPVSVNVGYEYGSVESFEYGRAGNDADDRNTESGVPMPYVDMGRP